MTTTTEQSIALLLLIISQLPGIGPSRARALVNRFGPTPALLEADYDALRQIPGVGETIARETAERLASPAWRQKAGETAAEQLARAELLRATVVTILDPAYPPLLKEIYDPPLLLFVRGNPDALRLPSLAVVGTRKATAYGKQATEFICREMAGNGYAIFSGLAYGIDMMAHRAAVESDGVTVAVLGCGIDRIYTDPAGRLWPRILERGAIVSEEWIGIKPEPGNFPRRNRLISGLTQGTLIVESDIKGGSMITAACALEQNREVFAIPGSIFSAASRGANFLIQQNQARPVFSAGDILAELDPSRNPAMKQTGAPEPLALNIEESCIVEALQSGAMHIDLIADKTGLTIDALLVHLFELELKRVVEQEPGQIFRKRTQRST
ncbi:DNA protecting protein DprA [Chlorobaculum limnaeum]|uniref:DNA protecting protein DprA n=1 Tax=Chlorobaculum limnaeum TaxID=274537 RepID=A0A1D8D3S7_CHLLM|nr:DNA-processing protein DprA [Chlorobaculum limnaeum]AOS82874.1 DNA protecting protein DprA [Chlorobaculum limnaeum]